MKIYIKKRFNNISCTVELFNDNHHDNEISDIRRIINRLRDIILKKDRKGIKDKLYKIEHQRNI